MILPVLAGRWYIQWLGKPDNELGPLLDCLGSLCPQGKAGFFPSLEREVCEYVKLKLFGIYISPWLCRQAAIDRVLGMYCGEMGHMRTFLKAKVSSPRQACFLCLWSSSESRWGCTLLLGWAVQSLKAFSDTGQPFKTSRYLLVPWDGT